MRLEITDDCCGTARRLIADGLDPNEMLEFCRGEVVCLRGTVRAFASRRVKETDRIGPVHVPWTPRPAFWSAEGATADGAGSDLTWRLLG